ncbi:MAG: hypothetical protein IJ519_00635, partial [Clostridia bacterium]|nr:hypothetical protein [Clostridia bacterium]
NGTVSADKKTVTFDGEDLTATINGNTLSLTDSTGEAMVFTKSGSGSVVTPTPDSKSELDGTWTCEIDGADFIGDEYAGITITMTFIANGDTCSLTTEVMGQGDTMNGTVSADKKTVTFDGEDLTVAISGNTLTLTDSTGEAMVFTK